MEATRASWRPGLDGQHGWERARLCLLGHRRVRRDVAGSWHHRGWHCGGVSPRRAFAPSCPLHLPLQSFPEGFWGSFLLIIFNVWALIMCLSCCATEEAEQGRVEYCHCMANPLVARSSPSSEAAPAPAFGMWQPACKQSGQPKELEKICTGCVVWEAECALTGPT